MAVLNIIGDTLPAWESAAHRAATRDLGLAVAETAPRGCSAALLFAHDTEPIEVDHPKLSVQNVMLKASMLPVVWHSSQAARPLDGEFMHALTPLAPLRSRDEYDGSQSTVTVPHTLAWDRPETLPRSLARTMRSFTRRAVKHADMIITPTHATARRIEALYSDQTPIQVLPLAAPREFLPGDDAATRRTELELPDEYVLTFAYPGEYGRLEWILRAYEVSPHLPPLVVVNEVGEFDPANWSVLGDRVRVVKPRELDDLGAIISGATLLVAPQRGGDTGYALYGALNAGIPIVHCGAEDIAEVALDAGAHAETEVELNDQLRALTASGEERERLSVLARDRSRNFTWASTAWQLWEIHANI